MTATKALTPEQKRVQTEGRARQKFIADILAGRHDGHLEDVALAIKDRLKDGAVDFVWRITLPGEEPWDAYSVTAGEIRRAERWTGKAWWQLDPRQSMDHFVALVAAHYMAAAGDEDHKAAIAKAGALTQKQFADAVDEYEVVNPPKDVPAPSTST